jgi:hypothetical protein
MPNRITVNGVAAELDDMRVWRSADEGLRATLEVKAGLYVAGGATPDPVGRQLEAAVRSLGAVVVSRDPYIADDTPGRVF